jgi:iron complex outermembrane receptor protein
MRRLNRTLWSTTAVVAALCVSSVASAQEQQPAPPNPDATGQQNPAQPAQNADAPQSPATIAGNGNPDESTIVVTGLRRSLQSARNIKRNSDQIVDAVVAEDIGKLPDITVSDTAARIPGVEVERSGGEANRVLLRGLDNTFYTTTYNGREIFTAETRSVALQDFPAGAIASVEAFKTSTANLVEPGIAGLINVRSRRPFDFQGLELSGSAWALYPNQSRDTSINGNLLLSDRWNAGNGEFGALINVSYTRIHYQDSVRRHGFFIANLDGGRSPDWPEIHYNEGDRWRPSVNGALQYRNGDLELYFEGLWQGYRERVTDRMFAQPLWNCGQAVYSNIVFRPGTNDIVSGTVQNPGCPNGNSAWGFQGATHRETNTYQFAGGGTYEAGPLHISADLAHTNSHFQLRTESVDEQLATNQYTVNWFTGKPGGPGPTFQVQGIDLTDPANYEYRGFFEDYQDPKGKDWQGRVDFDYDTRLNFLPKIQWGVRYVDRDASDIAGSLYWNAGPAGGPNLHIPISSVPLNYILHNPAFHGDNLKPFPLTWLSPTYDSVWDDLQGFRQFNIDLLGFGSVDGPPVDPGRSFSINEKTLAGYGQLNLRVGEGDVYADGILGVRVVRTKDDIEGTQFSPTAPPSPIAFKNKYTDWLPNLNINLHMGRPWVLRLAATKTITRPTFQQINPSLHLDQVPGCVGQPGQSGCFRTASGGNPFLEPLRSNNYDASLEYYFSQTGYASVGAFRRDMKGFIVNRQFEFPNPDPETGLPLLFTGPANSSKARLQGFEAQIRTFFDFGPSWLRAFGVDANVSYIDAKAVQDVISTTPPSSSGPGLAAVQRMLPIPDVSKWTWNLTGMYESGPLSVRLSYNRRSRYWEGGLSLQSDGSGFYTLQGHARQSPRLDLSASYNLNDHFTLFGDWTNILGHPFQSDIVRVNYGPGRSGTPVGTEVFPMVIRYEERIVSGGVRFNFGGSKPAPAPVPAYIAPPPPPPPAAVEPAPVEQPVPPPPAPTPERG